MKNKLEDIEITQGEGVTDQEMSQIIAEEIATFDAKGKTLGSIVVSLDNDELVVASTPISPIIRIRRITGYCSRITSFGDSKLAELKDRVTHM